jgi:hypothetical protein
MVCAQGDDGIVHLAEYSLLVGVKLKDVPPGLGTRQDVLATYRLTKRGSPLCWNLRGYTQPELDETGAAYSGASIADHLAGIV